MLCLVAAAVKATVPSAVLSASGRWAQKWCQPPHGRVAYAPDHIGKMLIDKLCRIGQCGNQFADHSGVRVVFLELQPRGFYRKTEQTVNQVQCLWIAHQDTPIGLHSDSFGPGVVRYPSDLGKKTVFLHVATDQRPVEIVADGDVGFGNSS